MWGTPKKTKHCMLKLGVSKCVCVYKVIGKEKKFSLLDINQASFFEI